MKHMIAALPVARTLRRPSYLAPTLPLAVRKRHRNGSSVTGSCTTQQTGWLPVP